MSKKETAEGDAKQDKHRTDRHFEFTACALLLIERHQRKKDAPILHVCCETEDNYQDRGIKVRSAMQNGRSAAPFAR